MPSPSQSIFISLLKLLLEDVVKDAVYRKRAQVSGNADRCRFGQCLPVGDNEESDRSALSNDVWFRQDKSRDAVIADNGFDSGSGRNINFLMIFCCVENLVLYVRLRCVCNRGNQQSK